MTARTVATLCLGLLVAAYGAVIYTAAGSRQGWPGTGGDVARSQSYVDYVPIWTAGRFALEGRAEAAYDWTEHKAASFALIGHVRDDYQPWPYPPTFLAVAALLATLPYGLSMMLWVIATYAGAAAVSARIVGTPHAAIWLAASVPALCNALVGQNGALNAVVLGLGLLHLQTRPVLAGIFLGLLSYKPHLAALIPLALVAGGHWRVLASAAATAAAMALVSVLAFGIDAWAAFVARAPDVADLVLNRRPEILQSVFGGLTTLGLPRGAALAIHGALALAVAGSLVWLWRQRHLSLDVKAAALAGAMLLVSPYQFVYDLTILMVAQAYLLRGIVAGRDDGIDVIGMIAANAIILFGIVVALPFGPVAVLLLLALVARRAAQELGLNPNTAMARGGIRTA